MDFHGVGSEGEKANVLGAINLDLFHVELGIMEHQTAENVISALCAIGFYLGRVPRFLSIRIMRVNSSVAS
jgi:uncharacterized membrane protein